ncbi:MAG: hypothetical protein Q9166_001623 [cf. Caloplaca sp. 2 TL-2023]
MALCQNQPYTNIIAGQTTPSRVSTSKRSAASPPLFSVLLCAPNSRTYIELTPDLPLPPRLVLPVITSAQQQIQHQIAPPNSDRIINFHTGWIFNSTVGAYELRVRNEGVDDVPLWIYGLSGQVNRHVTYRILSDALLALKGYMDAEGWRGAVFGIYHAGKQVGFGELGPVD